MRAFIFGVLVITLASFGCGSTPASSKAPKVDELEMQLPAEIVGLRVTREDITGALERVRPSYVKEAALFSLRGSNDLVRATLQVSRFRDEDRFQTSSFRRSIITQLGATAPKTTRMKDQTVWRTSGTNLSLAVWFEGQSMYLLSIRDDFDRPRTLIRTLIDLEAA